LIVWKVSEELSGRINGERRERAVSSLEEDEEVRMTFAPALSAICSVSYPL
jgi:hypothetical protein